MKPQITITYVLEEDTMYIELDGKEIYEGYQGFDDTPVRVVAEALGATVKVVEA